MAWGHWNFTLSIEHIGLKMSGVSRNDSYLSNTDKVILKTCFKFLSLKICINVTLEHRHIRHFFSGANWFFLPLLETFIARANFARPEWLRAAGLGPLRITCVTGAVWKGSGGGNAKQATSRMAEINPPSLPVCFDYKNSLSHKHNNLANN